MGMAQDPKESIARDISSDCNPGKSGMPGKPPIGNEFDL